MAEETQGAPQLSIHHLHDVLLGEDQVGVPISSAGGLHNNLSRHMEIQGAC